MNKETPIQQKLTQKRIEKIRRAKDLIFHELGKIDSSGRADVAFDLRLEIIEHLAIVLRRNGTQLATKKET